MLHESFGIGGWLLQGALLAAAIAAPLLSAHASMTERALPAFHELLTPAEGRNLHFATRILGFTLIVTTLIAAQTALGLVFDARWRDFSFAALTMAVVPFWTVGFLKPAKSGAQPLAEAVFAGLFGLAALYIIFNEGFNNWQSLWTSAAYLVLGITLWRPRAVAVTETESIAATELIAADGIDRHNGRACRGRFGGANRSDKVTQSASKAPRKSGPHARPGGSSCPRARTSESTTIRQLEPRLNSRQACFFNRNASATKIAPVITE